MNPAVERSRIGGLGVAARISPAILLALLPALLTLLLSLLLALLTLLLSLLLALLTLLLSPILPAFLLTVSAPAARTVMPAPGSVTAPAFSPAAPAWLVAAASASSAHAFLLLGAAYTMA